MSDSVVGCSKLACRHVVGVGCIMHTSWYRSLVFYAFSAASHISSSCQPLLICLYIFREALLILSSKRTSLPAQIFTLLFFFLNVVFVICSFDCRPPTSSTVNLDGKKDKNATAPPETPDTVVLLADSSLLELPLEALDMFESHHILSMSRDLSLQMLYHRFFEEQLTRKSFISSTPSF